MTQILAHTHLDSNGTLRTESLLDHLRATSELARVFAAGFGCENLAEIVARFHDLGKASDEFQRYLAQSSGDTEESDESPKAQSRAKRSRGPDHSTAGAKFLADKLPDDLGTLLAYAIAGHHAGLPDGIAAGNTSLEYRLLFKEIPEWESFARAALPPEFFSALPPRETLTRELRPFFASEGNIGFAFSFLLRMIFSCLVDADFLATEKFMNTDKAQQRTRSTPANAIPTLEMRLEKHLRRFDDPVSPLGKIRNEIREDCLAAAELSPGIFTLSVPTGGGKTLSSLAFALKHAKLHDLRRVIYVIPFTSIIEQNAEVFAEALGKENILEHHCNAEFDDDALETRQKLAAENWDAPIVATTSVQFYESLFSHKTSRCRKLHNIAKSVVILDEAQTIPADFLLPCLRALDELARNYGTTIVLCTATQPAVDAEKLRGGLRGNAHGIREIIAPHRNLHERLRRVSVSCIAETLSDEALAEKILRERQTLTIVNTRSHARKLFEALRNRVSEDERESVFHLSAQMCPEHRNEILDTIKTRLREGKNCRVVSTQLVEAGVDIDFPCVFRAMTGIDSIAQAAGRCNREGKIGGNGGRVFIFEPETPAPAGFLRASADCGREVLSIENLRNDPLSQETVTEYFRLLYWKKSTSGELDKEKILTELLNFQGEPLTFRLRTTGEKFRLIDDKQKTVLVPYGNAGLELCERLRETFDPAEQKELARKLRRFAVSIPEKAFDQAVSAGTIKIIHERFAVLESGQMNYSRDFGISLQFGGTEVFLAV